MEQNMKNFTKTGVLTWLFCAIFTAYNLKAAVTSADEVIEKMLPHMLVVGFSGSQDHFPADMRKLLEEGKVGNIIIFTRNIDPDFKSRKAYEVTPPANPEMLRAKFKDFMGLVKQLIPEGFICMDMEGGYVQRFLAELGYPQFPSAAALGKEYRKDNVGGLQIATEAYTQMATLLKDHHVNFNLGPVLDLTPEGYDCPVISKLERSYDTEPEIVAKLAETFVKAHKEKGIVTCAKHMPGHGYAKSDTHFDLTDVTEVSNPATEMEPYRLLNDKGLLSSVMMAHVVNGKMDNTNRPASVSKIINDTVRQYLGQDKCKWSGLCLCDALEMKGLHKWYEASFPSSSVEEVGDDSKDRYWKRIIIDAIMAGQDLLLLCNVGAAFIRKAIEWVKEAVNTHEELKTNIIAAYNRIIALKKEYGII